MSCGSGHRRGSIWQLLWLWHKPAAVAPTGPQAWEPPYAMGAALKKGKKKQKKKIKNKKEKLTEQSLTTHKNCLT